MNTGMMWFDNDPKLSLVQKVIKAADYFRKKYGQVPTFCVVHPTAMPADGASLAPLQLQVDVVTVKTARYILPGHLWIGTEKEDS
jgi:hypothetical protein